MVRYTILDIVNIQTDTHLRQSKLDELGRNRPKYDLRYCDLRYHPFLDLG